MKPDKVFDLYRERVLATIAGHYASDPAPPVPYYLDNSWRYMPAATHGDSQAFAARQRERARRVAK
jgi:hypothetical protein